MISLCGKWEQYVPNQQYLIKGLQLLQAFFLFN
jgi:hypothetical protein